MDLYGDIERRHFAITDKSFKEDGSLLHSEDSENS